MYMAYIRIDACSAGRTTGGREVHRPDAGVAAGILAAAAERPHQRHHTGLQA